MAEGMETGKYQRKNEETEETVTIPKSQITLLYAQINSLAKSVAEKEKQARTTTTETNATTEVVKPMASTPGPGLTRSLTGGSKGLQRSQPIDQLGGSSTLKSEDIRALLDALPVYSGTVGECFKWWTQQVESFCKTFNIKVNKIEYYIPQQLVKGKALERYRELQKEYASTTAMSVIASPTNNRYKRFLPWKILTKELSKLDNPILRSIYIHEQLSALRSTTTTSLDEHSVISLVTRFRKLEAQLDPAPLGDRISMFFQVLPEARPMILEKITSNNNRDNSIFNNVDELCDCILIHLDELVKSIIAVPATSSSTASPSPSPDLTTLTTPCTFCNKTGHVANKCFKRKKERQKEKIKLYDSLQQQQQVQEI